MIRDLTSCVLNSRFGITELMSFFDKVKQFFGFVGVKVELETPLQIEKAAGSFQGKVSIRAEKEQKIATVTVKLEEEWKSGRGEDATERTFDLGEVTIAQDFQMTAGESKTLDFTLPFEMVKSRDDRLQEQGGVVGKLGSLSKLASGEKSTFRVKAEADVVGAAFDPSASKNVKLV